MDLTGERYGLLEVVSYAGFKIDGRGCKERFYYCLCDCGCLTKKRQSNLRSGDTKSCGCLQKAVARARKLLHGQHTSNTYKTKHSMVQRCYNPNNKRYKDYGGRGISVCDRWLGEDGFINFLADMGEQPKGYQLDRIDNDGN